MIMFLSGVASVIAVGLVISLAVDSEMRRACGEVLMAVVMAPVLLPIAVARRGPRARRLSAEALARFAQQSASDMRPAWLFSMGARGVIFVRRRDHGWWRNNVSNRAVDALRDHR